MPPRDGQFADPQVAPDHLGSYLPLLTATLAEVPPAQTASPSTRLSSKTRDDLEWPLLLAELAGYCETEEGKRLAGKLPLLRLRPQIERRLQEVEEACSLLAEGGYPSCYGVDVIAPTLEYAQLGGVLDGAQLLAIARAAKASDEAARIISQRRDRAVLLSQVARDLKPMSWLSDLIGRMVDSDGKLVDNASPDLAELRDRVRRSHERLRQKIEGYLKNQEYEDYLQDRFFTIREGRFVLPVRVGERRNVPGIVHGYSGSGQSVFIEPTELVEMNNQFRLAEIEVEAEERRIFYQLSQEVANAADDLKANVDRLFYLDLTGAAGHLAREMRAGRPRLSEGHRVRLLRARHPLLALRQARSPEEFTVVPNDIGFGHRARQGVPAAPTGSEAAGRDTPSGRAVLGATPPLADQGPLLVISGPNAGGKTVILKTIGLCALMIRAGLLLPAEEESEIPLFGHIFTDVGDEQSLSENLSSFTAHLTHVHRFLPLVDEHSLVLLDELFSGTDPAQGAAMAIAVLEELASRGALVVATTHFDTLKRYALKADRFQCASMGFDMKTLSPTFELRSGIPGASYAIGIARRLGFPGEVLDRAQELIEGRDQDNLEEVLTELDAYRCQLAEREAAARAAQEKAERTRREYLTEREKLQREALEAVDHNLTRVFEEIKKAEILVRRRRRELSVVPVPETTTPQHLEEIQRELAQVKEELTEQKKERERAEIARTRRPLEAAEVQPDRPVWVAPFGRAGTVVQVDSARGQALVQLGVMKVTVRLAELFETETAEQTGPKPSDRGASTPLPEKAPAPPPQPVEITHREPSGWLGPQTVNNTVDLRGLRVEDALEHLERMLDAAYQRREAGVYVIHGHGTGALRAAVRGALPGSPYVRSFRPGERNEGGDGVTVTWLKTD